MGRRHAHMTPVWHDHGDANGSSVVRAKQPDQIRSVLVEQQARFGVLGGKRYMQSLRGLLDVDGDGPQRLWLEDDVEARRADAGP